MNRRLSWIAPAGLTLVLLGACSSDSDTSTTTTSLEEDLDEAVTNNTTAEEAAEEVRDVGVIESDFGKILVDGAGYTLYVTKADVGGVPTCVDACAEAWPPFVSENFELSDELSIDDFDLTTRPDGTAQATYMGQPLYLFSGDVEPGETTGQGLNDTWFVVVVSE